MLLNRLLRIVNVVIALLLAAFLAGVYWFAVRPLPETSGEVRLPVRAEARIVRDARGVPHIFAANMEDLLFLQGYATAQDRLFQMDGIRRLAAGELAEIAGPAALEMDAEARRLGLRRIAAHDFSRLPSGERAHLAAYARGVNCYLETHRDRLPLEFSLARYEPRPWSIQDTMLVSGYMYRVLTTNWKEELSMESLLASGDKGMVMRLFPSALGGDTQPGSNAWVISGRHTASGKPILANDPHLEYGVPPIWHMVHLKAPGINVAGAALPGAPFLIIGHNEKIAWGVTNMMVDVQDLYIEKLDPGTGRYEYKGQIEQAQLDREVIAVRGAKPVEMPVWITRHGPIFLSRGNRQYALKWAAADAEFRFVFAEIDKASNWHEFREALRQYPGPGQNFVYADREGNIGYQATGRFPIRRGFTGQFPVSGSDGEHEWEGYIPFDDLPSIYNPPSGMLVTANQSPFPPGYKWQVNGNFASPDRWRQIRDLLRSHEGWKPGEMLAVEKDVYSPLCDFLARQAVAAFDRKKPAPPRVAAAVDLLRGWNGQMEKGTAAPMVVSLLYQHLRHAIAERAAPSKGGEYRPDFLSPRVLREMLEERPAGWYPDWDKMLLDNLADAVDEGSRMQGERVSKWDYGIWNRIPIMNPVLSRLPFIGTWFEVGIVPMSGSSTTVKQTIGSLHVGPSMRFVADLSEWDNSLHNITVGESGQVLSRHYKDQWNAYYTGSSFPMQFNQVKGESELVVKPR